MQKIEVTSLPFVQSKNRLVQVHSIISLVLYGSRDAGYNMRNFWADIVKRPWSRSRSLSHIGIGALGSTEGWLIRFVANPYWAIVGSQQVPYPTEKFDTSITKDEQHCLYFSSF